MPTLAEKLKGISSLPRAAVKSVRKEAFKRMRHQIATSAARCLFVLHVNSCGLDLFRCTDKFGWTPAAFFFVCTGRIECGATRTAVKGWWRHIRDVFLEHGVPRFSYLLPKSRSHQFFRPETDTSLTIMLYHLCLKNRKTRQMRISGCWLFSATGHYSLLIISFDCFFLLIILNLHTNLKS